MEESADVEKPEAEIVEIGFPSLEVDETPLGVEVTVELERVKVDEATKLTLDSEVIDRVGETVSELYLDTVAVESLELADSTLLWSEDFVAEAEIPDAAEKDAVELFVDESGSTLERVEAVDNGVEELVLISVMLRSVEACDEVVLALLVDGEEVDDRSLELWRSLFEIVWKFVLEEEPILAESRERVKNGEYVGLDESTEAVLERLADDVEYKSGLGVLAILVSVELLEVEESELVAERVALVETLVGDLDVPAIALGVSVLDILSVFEDSELDTGELEGTLAEDEIPLSIELDIAEDADVVVKGKRGEEGLELSEEIEDGLEVVLVSVIVI